MKQYLFILFTFSFSSLVFSQPKQLVNYYAAVNKAEVCITQHKLDSSLLYYQQAFSAWPNPFGRDIYNAAVVACKKKWYPLTSQYLTRLLKLGGQIADMKAKTVFAPFFQSKPGKRFSLISPRIKPTYDLDYRKKIEALVAADQEFRTKKGSYTLYSDTIKKIDEKNVSALLQLINEKGFPSEAKIGIKDIEWLTTPLYSTIIIHQSSGPWQQYSFAGLIRENILLGNIENKAGLFMINRSEGSNFFDIVQVQFVKAKDSTASLANPANYSVIEASDWGFYPLNEKEAMAVNAKRKALMLDDHSEHLTKVLFSIKNPDYLLSAFGSKSTINHAKYDDYITEKKALRFQ
jgi:hypothetical protein